MVAHPVSSDPAATLAINVLFAFEIQKVDGISSVLWAFVSVELISLTAFSCGKHNRKGNELQTFFLALKYFENNDWNCERKES